MPPLVPGHKTPSPEGEAQHPPVIRKNNQWTATFPANSDLKEYSKMFMSRTLYIVFAYILESRRLLPQNCFRKRSIDEMVKTYVMNLHDPIGLRISDKFRGAGDAIKLGFLREFMLVVGTNEENDDEAIEVFSFRIRYDNDGIPSMEFNDNNGNVYAKLNWLGLDYIKKQTIGMLFLTRKLCRYGLRPLPEGAFATFRVTYTDSAPKGYQAPGFYRHPVLYNLDPKAETYRMGSLETKYHSMHLEVKSVCIDDGYTLKLRMEQGDFNRSTVAMNETSANLNDSIDEPTTDSHNDSAESLGISPTKPEDTPAKSSTATKTLDTSGGSATFSSSSAKTKSSKSKSSDENKNRHADISRSREQMAHMDVEDVELPRGHHGSSGERSSSTSQSSQESNGGAGRSTRAVAARGRRSAALIRQQRLEEEDTSNVAERGSTSALHLSSSSPEEKQEAENARLAATKSPRPQKGKKKTDHGTPPRAATKRTPGKATSTISPGASPPKRRR